MAASQPTRRSADLVYLDADGQGTDDPGPPIGGELVEYDDHGRITRRTRFFLNRSELPWLPVSEPAFLLWVLAALVLVWICIAILLYLV
jgi:hypothetical protein